MDDLIKTVLGEREAKAPATASSLYNYDDALQKIKITVIGVGGAGSNAVSRLYEEGVQSAKTIAVNTDANHLSKVAKAHEKILLGKVITRGLGAGGDPEMGRKCAEADYERIKKGVTDNEIVFISAGLGGGTGTGAAPYIAKVAKESGALVVSVVTFPFRLERSRVKVAHRGLTDLLLNSDTVILIDNNKLLEFAPNMPLEQAFKLADSIIVRAVKGISDCIVLPSLMNIDYADVRAVMKDKGLAMIAVGNGEGPDRVNKAVETTLKHPLLDVDFKGAKGGIIHIEGSEDLTLGEAVEIGERVTESFDQNAEVKMGARITPPGSKHDYATNKITVSAIVTGVTSPQMLLGGDKRLPEGDQIMRL